MGHRKVMIRAALVALVVLVGSAGVLKGESGDLGRLRGASGVERLIKGETLFQEGKWQEAMAEYQETICRSEQAGDPAALALAVIKQGELLTVLNNEPKAELSLQRALGLLPDVQKDGEVWEPQARQALGTVYFKTGRFVPHGVLHFLPFAALWDGKEYLGDSYTLSYSPSATVLRIIRQRKARASGPILAAGDPDGSLPFAAAEARSAARLFHSTPLTGRAATEGQVVARAHQSGILHLAAHAVLNPVNPLFTRIELAPDEEHDGNLEMQEVFGLDLSRTGLVVLSACSTQLGQLSAGDEIEGLTRAFLYAGTPAVMSSLWSVDDESTAFFMERFYSHLRKGRGRAESLKLAQAETRRRFPQPYHWAGFVLTGDVGKRDPASRSGPGRRD